MPDKSLKSRTPLIPERDHLAWLLAWLMFSMVAVPLLGWDFSGLLMLRTGLSGVLIVAAIATERTRLALVVGVSVALIASPSLWATAFIESTMLFVLTSGIEAVFFMCMAVIILVTVVRKHLATYNSILGAICSYLLFGLAWAIGYWAVLRVDSGAISGIELPNPGDAAGELAIYTRMLYFSFVTMSTLGYGDVFPVSGTAQTLAWMQSVTGQFYLAVVVAWLVSEIPARPRTTANDTDETPSAET